MTFIGVGGIGFGIVLLWAAYQGENALDVVRSVLRNEPIRTDPPPTGSPLDDQLPTVGIQPIRQSV